MNNHQLPYLFVGKWTVLTSSVKSGSSARPKLVTIEPVDDPQGRYQCSVYTDATDGSLSRETFPDLGFEDANQTLCCDRDAGREPAGFSIYLSYWRFPSYDVIFGVKEDESGDPVEAWSAKRCGRVAPSGDFKHLLEGEWKIRLTKGFHGACGQIKVRRFGVQGGAGASEGPELGLFGLFHLRGSSQEDIDPKTSPVIWDLYDVLTYDDRVGSFNSVFGVRSFNYQGGGVSPEKGRVFATFNNKSSVPGTRLTNDLLSEAVMARLGGGQELPSSISRAPGGASLPAHPLGQLMPFERSPMRTASAKNSGDDPPSGNDDPDDPDLGVWVGVPL